MKLRKILNKMLAKVPKTLNTEKYFFVCSMVHFSNVTKHKGYKVLYTELAPSDVIVFTNTNPYTGLKL